jgi:hypothetical protein
VGYADGVVLYWDYSHGSDPDQTITIAHGRLHLGGGDHTPLRGRT